MTLAQARKLARTVADGNGKDLDSTDLSTAFHKLRYNVDRNHNKNDAAHAKVIWDYYGD